MARVITRPITIPAKLVPVLNEIGKAKMAASLVHNVSVDLPEPAAGQIGYLAQCLQDHLESINQRLRLTAAGGKPADWVGGGGSD